MATTFEETIFEIGKDTPTCCYEIQVVYLDFNYDIARPGDQLACKKCGTIYELKENGCGLQWIRLGHLSST